ncbi:hypothetical protein [Terrisporobacter sp.]
MFADFLASLAEQLSLAVLVRARCEEDIGVEFDTNIDEIVITSLVDEFRKVYKDNKNKKDRC